MTEWLMVAIAILGLAMGAAGSIIAYSLTTARQLSALSTQITAIQKLFETQIDNIKEALHTAEDSRDNTCTLQHDVIKEWQRGVEHRIVNLERRRKGDAT